MGRSSDPGRERRRSGAGEAAVTVVQSRAGFGRGVFPWKRSRVGLSADGKAEVNIGLACDVPGVLLVEIGGFRFPNLRETQRGQHE